MAWRSGSNSCVRPVCGGFAACGGVSLMQRAVGARSCLVAAARAALGWHRPWRHILGHDRCCRTICVCYVALLRNVGCVVAHFDGRHELARA
jgi:hypothetical protein